MWHLAAALRRRCLAQSMHLAISSRVVESAMWIGVAHLVAPTPQAKGKIERRFGTRIFPRVEVVAA